jgi:hypothetical protein
MTIYLDNIEAVPARSTHEKQDAAFSGTSVCIEYPANVLSDVRGNWNDDADLANLSRGYKHTESLMPHAVAMKHNIRPATVNVSGVGNVAWLLSVKVKMPNQFLAPLYPFLFHVYSANINGTHSIDISKPIYRFRWNNEAWSTIRSLPGGGVDNTAEYRKFTFTSLGAIFVNSAKTNDILEIEVGLVTSYVSGTSTIRLGRAVLLAGFV